MKSLENPTALSALAWFKSSYSSNEGGECVEVATDETSVLVRDSKQPSRSHLTVGGASWSRFTRFAAGR